MVVAWSLGAGLLNRYGHGCIGRYIVVGSVVVVVAVVVGLVPSYSWLWLCREVKLLVVLWLLWWLDKSQASPGCGCG